MLTIEESNWSLETTDATTSSELVEEGYEGPERPGVFHVVDTWYCSISMQAPSSINSHNFLVESILEFSPWQKEKKN